ncbi:MAG: phosphoserine phosphatase [Polyangiaceae bacterium]|jgi:phosphatidylglycerophosphatase C|nr:phosphoserine phosphatase [Polyangiaceae bacterium]
MSLGSDVVVFDFDGTLVSRDSVLDFCFRYAARRPQRLLLVALVAPLAAVARLRSVAAAASVLLWALTVGTRSRKFVRALRGYAESVLSGFAHEEIFEQLSRELSQGRRVVLATGALPTLVRGVLRARGLPALPVVGSRLRRRYGGFVVATHCVGPVKPQELARRLHIHAWDAVYTDSWADRALMRGARRVALVSPSPRLLQWVEPLVRSGDLSVFRPAR